MPPNNPNASRPQSSESSSLRLLQIESGVRIPLETLELNIPSTPHSVSLERLGNFLGAGGEKAAFDYTDSRGSKLVLTVERPSSNQRVAAVRLPASVALNARMANVISRPENVLTVVEDAHERQRQLGIRGKHYLQILDRYPGKEAIEESDYASFNAMVRVLSGNRTLHPDTFKYIRAEEFQGGLVGYINYLFGHIKELNAHLPIGVKIFPDVYSYGVFTRGDVMPPLTATRAALQAVEKGKEFNPNLAGRPWMTVERYETTLGEIIDKNLEYVMLGRNQTERLQRMAEVVGKGFPLASIGEIVAGMNLVHALGYCFGDLKLDNIAFKKLNGGTVGLIPDPGLVKEGKTVLYASVAYLPDGNFRVGAEVRHPMSELKVGRLRAARELDNYAMQVITHALFEGMEDPVAFDRLLMERKRQAEMRPSED